MAKGKLLRGILVSLAAEVALGVLFALHLGSETILKLGNGQMM